MLFEFIKFKEWSELRYLFTDIELYYKLKA